jgi:hypothetical protein
MATVTSLEGHLRYTDASGAWSVDRLGNKPPAVVRFPTVLREVEALELLLALSEEDENTYHINMLAQPMSEANHFVVVDEAIWFTVVEDGEPDTE